MMSCFQTVIDQVGQKYVGTGSHQRNPIYITLAPLFHDATLPPTVNAKPPVMMDGIAFMHQ